MYSVSMAVVDFFPVILFGASVWILQRDLYNKMSKGAYALLCAGTIDVFMAGALKAFYKLLYAAGVCDFQPLSQLFFPLQALGFLMTGIALVCMVTRFQGKGTCYSVAAAPALYTGTFIFVTLMVAGLGGMAASLSVLARRMKKAGVILLFVVSFIFSMMMGYLSSKDFSQSYMNWAAEVINTLGQLSLFLGVKALDKAGLREFRL